MSAGFEAARRAALMTDLLAVLAGRPTDLLPFETVRRELGLRHLVDRGIQQVPLDRIVGTLGRPGEFNRAFLPRDEALRDRWDRLLHLAEGPLGFPPIELYQVDQAYFVVDGHHRVSVARSLGAPTIEAHVTEFLTPVPLEPGVSLEDVLLHSGQAAFLEATGLTAEAPDDYRVTVPDGYERLIEHIRGHGYYRGIEEGRDVPWHEEVTSWRDRVYRPMIGIIRASGILEEFPGRTETDLYLFVMDHLHNLRQRYHNPAMPPEAAIEDFEAPPGRLRSWWNGLKTRWARRKESHG
ncbi:MAG TPA: transcriptional regulator [Thermoanaerobaculia bacterium]